MRDLAMAWRLNTALTNWRAAVDRKYPGRDRGSDGTIGDEAHQQTASDHNRDADGTVDAWDMDVNLRSGNDAAAIEELKQVFQRHPAARYWIHNRQIAHRSTGWRREPYAGKNPHDKHVHWNSNQATEDSAVPWILEADDMAIGDDIYRLLHDGKRREGLAETAGGGVPIAWLPREIGEIQGVLRTLATELVAVKADLATLTAKLEAGPGGITQEMLNEAIRTVMGSVDGASPQA